MFLSRFLSIASRFSKDGTSTTIFHMGSDPAQHFFPSFFSETFRSTAPIIFWCSKSTIKSWFFPKQWSFKWDLTRIVEAKEAGGKPRPSLDFGKSSQRPQNILANSESDTCVYIYISMRIAITCNNNNQIIFSDVFFFRLGCPLRLLIFSLRPCWWHRTRLSASLCFPASCWPMPCAPENGDMFGCE